MTDQPVDHRAEAGKALALALTWLAAPQPDSGKATAYAAVGIGHALLSRGLPSGPSTVTVHVPESALPGTLESWREPSHEARA